MGATQVSHERITYVQKKHRVRIAILLLLVSVFLFHGCEFLEDPVESPPESGNTPIIASPPSDVPARNPSQPGQFTIRYVPDSPVNPITSLSGDNIVLSSLLYESLFTLDSSLNAEPVLCDSWSTEDNVTYTFIIKSNIAMSDGSLLTADDVVYTYNQAKTAGLFVNRLSEIKSIETDEALTVTIVLNSANNRLIQLLDIPIIKNGSINEPIPPGTGPYMFAVPGAMRLVRFVRYRDYSHLPLVEIKLLECAEYELAELFDGGDLSLLWDDPSDTFDIILNRHNEVRYYDTTTLQYIGFNARSVVLADADVRRAIGSSINRQYITDTIMSGLPLAAPLALSPAYRLYDLRWEEVVIDPLKEMSALLIRAGLEDFDNDSFLEYPDGFGGFFKIALDFIVNINNAYKVKTAHKIADTLRLYGFEIIVRELSWEDFQDALKTGTFDMYYGEISLSADFDLSPLLLPKSPHDYGLTGNEDFRPFIEDFLSAQTDAEERRAAELLCDEINLKAPFVPILYKKYAVYSPIGAISGAAPSQSGVFNDFAQWKIDLTMIP